MTLGDSLGPQGKRPELYGVGGWLAFLCVSLLFLTPLGIVVDIIRTLPDPDMTPAQKAVGVGLDIALAGYAIFVGISLSRMRPNALRIAKTFFFATLALWLFVGASAALVSEVTTAIQSARQLIVAMAWLAYLYRSERVRNTYSRARIEEVSEAFR